MNTTAIQSAIAGSTFSVTIAKSVDLLVQQLSGRPINLRQTAGVMAIGMCGGGMTGALGGGAAVEFGTGLSLMPWDILNGLFPKKK
ncbi:hypothetical protein D3C87_1384340 [compost metagenome]